MSSNYQVHFGKRAEKKLKKMDKHQSHLIMSWIKKNLVNTSDPRQFGKELVGEWRYRIGDYRLLANIDDETITILILELGHRREIYKYFRFLKSPSDGTF